MPQEPVLMSWSGGKDSAFALAELLREGKHRVVALITTVTEQYDRISMHGVRRQLLVRQAQSLGLPLEIVFVPPATTNEVYEARMKAVLEKHQQCGVGKVVFGDIFLEDLRQYRESKLAQVGMTGLFPLWKRDTKDLARAFIDGGFKSVLTCVDGQSLDGRFVGRRFDRGLLAELPPSIDPCGENGEFHSFCFDGPIFSKPIEFTLGEKVVRESRFHYCDLVEA